MRYFSSNLLNSSTLHKEWWGEVSADRQGFHNAEQYLASLSNQSAILPKDAWMEIDGITRSVMRNDEGQAFMADLMPLAKAVNIGKLVYLTRVSGDAGTVVRSMSGQPPVPVDKVNFDYRGTPIPIFQTAYGREWREWNALQSENFNALADDQEAHTAKIRRDMALYALDGDANISVQGYKGFGIRNNPLSASINLGTGAGGASIDLTTATSDAVDAFITQTLGAMLDDNLVVGKINLYVSPEIGRNFDKAYSGSTGMQAGTLMSYLLTNRRINKIAVTHELKGNEIMGFVPSSEYIRPLIGMAVNTTAKVRLAPTENYQFMIMGAMGLEIRADINGKTGVFHSVVVN